MLRRVGAKGQVVIPKALRDRFGLLPGSEVDFEVEDDTVKIVPAGVNATRGLRGRLAASGLAADLLADRSRELR
jgi:AbrB family looped-hinge helix DNA binding protein